MFRNHRAVTAVFLDGLNRPLDAAGLVLDVLMMRYEVIRPKSNECKSINLLLPGIPSVDIHPGGH